MTSKLATIVILFMLALLISSGASAEFNRNSNIPAPALAPIGTAFTYQGYITDTGSPANGSYNLSFKLFDDASAGTQVGSTVPKNAVTVSDGYFTVELDFGDEFDGTALWLEIEVQGPGDPGFTALSPRQPLTAVPYALYAFDAQSSLQPSNQLIVAKSGGDFTSIQPAIDSISDAAADNPYLVWVAPGVYSETVTMKPYVHLQGAGQEATVITSTASSSVWPPTQATLILSSDVSLRDLTLGNSGTGNSNVALLATAGMTRTVVADVTARALGGGVSNFAILLGGSGTDVTLQQVTALAENGSSDNIGLDNHSGAAVLMHGGIFTGRGGVNGWGIFNVGSDTTLDAENVTALGENGIDLNNGLYNYDSAGAVLRGGVFTGRGGNQTGGVANQQNSTLTAEDVTTLAENGNDNYSLGNYDGAVMTVRGAVVTARGGVNNYALTNEFNVTMEAESVTALAEDGSSANYGLWNVNNGQATVRGGSFTGSGGTDAYGIYSHNSGTTLDTDSVTALGENGSNFNFGLDNSDGATTVLSDGSFTGQGGTSAFGIYSHGSGTTLEADGVTALGANGSSSDYALYQDGGSVSLGVSQLDGNATRISGTVTCFQVYNGSYVGYTCP